MGGATKPPAGGSGDWAGNRDGRSLPAGDTSFGAEIEAISQVGRWELDPRAGLMAWSDQQYRILGLEPGGVDPSFELFAAAVHDDDRTRLESAVERALASGGDLQLLHRIVRPDGEVRTVLSRARGGGGDAEAPAKLSGATLDVTDRHRERARLREREERLADLERLLGAGGLEWDPDTDWVEASPGLHRLLGAEAGTLDGPLAGLLGRVPAERREDWRLAFAGVAGGDTGSFEETRIECRDGSLLWVELRLEPNDPAAAPPRPVRGTIQDISRRKRTEIEVDRELEVARARAVRDPLTGLANRTLAIDRIGHALAVGRRRGADLGVLFIDLDDFKRVNDEHGHDEGDALIKEIGQRLRANVRGSDSVARYGGDEFVVLVEDVPGRDQVVSAAGRILEAFEAPFQVGARRHRVTPSIGITMAGRRPATPEQLIREADAAMYEAKAAGGGAYRVAGKRSAAS